MHTAYTVHQLLKLPVNLSVESLVSYGDNLLVGARQGRQGHLLMYSVKSGGEARGDATEDQRQCDGQAGGKGPPRMQLLRTNKHFSERPVVQLAVVPEYSILLSLSGGDVKVHDMDMAVTNFPVISSVERAKGAVAFAVDLLKQRMESGETGVVVKLAVAVKKRLMFFFWKNRKFHDFYPDVALNDVPKTIAWCQDSVCVGFRGEYSLIKVGSANPSNGPCELFPTGKNQEPSVMLMADGERFALGKDEQTTFIDTEGNMKLNAVHWGETPLSMANDPPYLLAVVRSGVEVRTDEPRLNVQTVSLPSPKFICTPTHSVADGRAPHGTVYVASHSHIWCLSMVPVAVQVPQLIRDKQFELAGTLSSIGGDSLESKAKRVQQIQTLNAFDSFCNFKFKEAMDLFYQLDVDTSHVVGLVADLLPDHHREKLSYPDRLPDLQGRERENAMLALVEYLTKVRHKLNNLPSDQRTITPLPIAEGQCIKSLKHMLQIVDTTLLKCYLKTNASLAASLLRLKDNHCHMEEAVRALKKNHKYAELVIFYNTKGAHEKALKLMKEHYNREDSPLKSHLKAVQYLQNLGSKQWDVIVQFAPWVMSISEKDGLSVFTEDLPEVESLPRPQVMRFLAEHRPSAVIPYLKHVVHNWKDDTALLHTSLAVYYKDYILESMGTAEGRSKELEGGRAYRASVEEARKELKAFLLSPRSRHDPSILEQEFSTESLVEERALILGSLGRHRESLILLLYRLRDIQAAMDYCRQFDSASGEGKDGVYSLAFKLLLKPPETQVLRSMKLPTNAAAPGDVNKALELLNLPTCKVDLGTVLESLPDSVPLERVERFLNRNMEARVSARNHHRLVRSLMHSEHLQVETERMALQAQRMQLTEMSTCSHCFKRFKNNGAVVRLSNGKVLHLSCYKGPNRVEI